jgi:transcription initiation factor TFIIIB Brf1 subunit/transcription initiation factor TFIIB
MENQQFTSELNNQFSEADHESISPDSSPIDYTLERPHKILTQEKIRSLIADLKPLDFPDEIKHEANTVFLNMNCPTKRSKKRKLLVFYCLYCAYLELRNPQVPTAIARKIPIKQSEIPKAMALFSEIQTGYRPPDIKITPIHYLKDYCSQLGFTEETTSMVIDLTDRLMLKDITLKEESPQKTSAGILQCFMIMNGIQFKKKEFAKMFGFSEVTINNIYKKILNIYSS